MKKTLSGSRDKQDSVAALMAVISDEISRADTQEDPEGLIKWFTIGHRALETFGSKYMTPAFQMVVDRLAGAMGKGESEEEAPSEPPQSWSMVQPRSPELQLSVFEEKFTPEAAASILNSSILFCNVIIAGNDTAAGLKYDEENMLIPMIVYMEKGPSAEALIWAAESLGVPVVKNDMLARNLSAHGRIGEAIPKASSRDVSMALLKMGSVRPGRRFRGFEKNRKCVPVRLPRPLSVELGETLFAFTGEKPGRDILLAKPLDTMRKRLVKLLGFSIAPVRISLDRKLKKNEYRILFKGIEAGRGRLELGWYAGPAFAAADDISRSAFPEIMNNPKNLQPAVRAGASAIIRHTSEIIQRRAPELIGRDEVEAILDAAEDKYPVVTWEVRNLLPLGAIREILQCLVSEQVSIRHIAVILETLADWVGYGPAPIEMFVEQIRRSLKRQICLEYADDGLTLRVLTLEPKLDKGFSDHSNGMHAEGGAGSGNDEWAELISAAVRGMEKKGYPPVILCSPKARFPVKEAMRRKAPNLAVLSFMEIPPDISVEPVGEIRLEGNIRISG
jgi:flagellar biosynthesis protein FlhA